MVSNQSSNDASYNHPIFLQPLKVQLFTDGGSRGNDKGEGKGQGAGAWMIFDEKGNLVEKGAKFFGEATNNEAEYLALIEGLKLVLRYKPSKVCCFSDSLLLVNQMQGNFKIKKDQLKKMAIQAKKVAAYFRFIEYRHVPRSHPSIRMVDRMLNKILDQTLNG